MTTTPNKVEAPELLACPDASLAKYSKALQAECVAANIKTAATYIAELEAINAYQKRRADAWRGIASAMGYEPKAHGAVKPTEPWIVERIAKFRRQVAEQEARTPDERIAGLVSALRSARAALHQHYVDWDGEPEDAVPLQLARAECDEALATFTETGRG